MAHDALDPGPNFTFPFLPRDQDGYLDTRLMPIGRMWQKGVDGVSRLVDVEPSVRLSTGELVKVTVVCPARPDGDAT